MNFFGKLILATALILTSTNVHAELQGKISFTAEEKAQHLKDLPTLLDRAAACLVNNVTRNQEFVQRYGISAYYGDQSDFGKLSYEGKKDYLRRLGLSAELLDSIEPNSCIGLALTCLEAGFTATGQEKLWTRIYAYVDLNGVTGTSLQNALRALGWKVYYWNPDVSYNETEDAAEQASFPGNPRGIWGNHAENWFTASTKGYYYENEIDDASTLVNFGTSVPEAFTRVPFYVGSAHGGYHVFPGSNGWVVEAHGLKGVDDRKMIEMSPFRPGTQGGGPQGNYRSGIVAIPPGYMQ